ncbi:mitochondrial genome maintenance MGM101-domain-containing protein [Abortiporus biennis]|nr:mitochondrial genome maintenance MGM101-domain-containing protein [Abortiporus biennis]
MFARNLLQARALSLRSRSIATKSWTPRTVPKLQAAKASTTSTNGNNAERITADEIADEILNSSSTPPESVPSSSVLQQQQEVGSFPAEGNGNGNGNGTTLDTGATDWSRSYYGLSSQPFPNEAADVLMTPVDPLDVEIKPDGLIYLPEIKYRRVLNKAFGPGGWGLAPRSETNVGPKVVSREYALVCLGRLVAIARGEQEYFDPHGIPTATEACKSNALMRCCKDLGVASELWDPRFIREFKAKYAVEVFAEHVPTKKKYKLWRRKDQPKFEYPYKE